jgi:hypothetical protein
MADHLAAAAVVVVEQVTELVAEVVVKLLGEESVVLATIFE